MAQIQPLRLRGDEATLFREYNDELVRVVGGAVRTSHSNVEDACAFAWSQFLVHQPDRDRSWKAWLFRVAQREAWKLHRHATRAELEFGAEQDASADLPTQRDTWDLVCARSGAAEALQTLHALPPRMRRAAMLRVAGLSYDEIAHTTGDTPRTVHRLLRQADERIRDAVIKRRAGERPSHARAHRLDELERQPPDWLVRAIGYPPTGKRCPMQTVIRWRRAAMLIDDYRTTHGVSHPSDPLGGLPADPAAARWYARVEASIARSLGGSRDNVSRALGH
jgi:RNA polymerase sigma factor (sigma-70 family)